HNSAEAAPVNHTEPGSQEEPRILPAVSHSKLDTETRVYPVNDLILADEKGRPVFDTCAFLDHLQAAVSPEAWSHPSVSMQFNQSSMSLVVRQTPEVHKEVESHLRYLRK